MITDTALFTAVRFALTVIPFIPFVIGKHGNRETRSAGIELGFWVSLAYLTQAVGLLTSEAGRATFISALTVIIVPLIDGLFGATVPAVTWIGAVASLVGVALLECDGSLPCVRNSAIRTLFQILGTHGQKISRSMWEDCLWNYVFPILDRVSHLAATSSRDEWQGKEIGIRGGKAIHMLIHHSRNTSQKQWDETPPTPMTPGPAPAAPAPAAPTFAPAAAAASASPTSQCPPPNPPLLPRTSSASVLSTTLAELYPSCKHPPAAYPALPPLYQVPHTPLTQLQQESSMSTLLRHPTSLQSAPARNQKGVARSQHRIAHSTASHRHAPHCWCAGTPAPVPLLARSNAALAS